jgi:hypothetical protein
MSVAIAHAASPRARETSRTIHPSGIPVIGAAAHDTPSSFKTSATGANPESEKAAPPATPLRSSRTSIARMSANAASATGCSIHG